MANRYLFTSESVSEGHPDKMADQISDAVLDAVIDQDPASRVAVETMVKTGFVMDAGRHAHPPHGLCAAGLRRRPRVVLPATPDAGCDQLRE